MDETGVLEFKRTSDCGESYFKDMWRVTEKQHTPIMTGLRALVEERGREVVVVTLVSGQRSVREKEWLETLRIFGIGKEDGQRIIGRLLYSQSGECRRINKLIFYVQT